MGSIRVRDMILCLIVGIYSSHEIHWCSDKNPKNKQLRNHKCTQTVPFCPKRAKMGSILAGYMILVSIKIYSNREIK